MCVAAVGCGAVDEDTAAAPSAGEADVASPAAAGAATPGAFRGAADSVRAAVGAGAGPGPSAPLPGVFGTSTADERDLAADALEEEYFRSLGFLPEEIPLLALVPGEELPADVQPVSVLPVVRAASRVLGPRGPGCDGVVALDPRNGDVTDPSVAVEVRYPPVDGLLGADLVLGEVAAPWSTGDVLEALGACTAHVENGYEVRTGAGEAVGVDGQAVAYRVDHVPQAGQDDLLRFADVVVSGAVDDVRVHAVVTVVHPDATTDAYELAALLVAAVDARVRGAGTTPTD